MTQQTTEQTSTPTSRAINRRTALVTGAIAAAGTALAACSSEKSSSSAAGSGSSNGGKVLAKTSDIPVGGGKIFKDAQVVVTQPTAGQYKAFSAICTHQGCPLSRIIGENIECTCHGSTFSINDGSVTNGPATHALPSEKITVSAESISLA